MLTHAHVNDPIDIDGVEEVPLDLELGILLLGVTVLEDFPGHHYEVACAFCVVHEDGCAARYHCVDNRHCIVIIIARHQRFKNRVIRKYQMAQEWKTLCLAIY